MVRVCRAAVHTHTHTHTHRAITAEPCRVHAPCSRVFVAILAGAASGIMGIEGIAGFVTFFASSMVLSLGMYLKMNSNPKPYFKTGSDVWTEGIGQALMVCHHRGDAWHILLRALTRTNPTAAPCSLLTGADACAVIRDVLDAILRHRAHLLSNPTGGSRGTTRHGARAVPGGRARGRADVAVHGQSVSSWCRPKVSCIVTKEMEIFLIIWRGRPLKGAAQAWRVLYETVFDTRHSLWLVRAVAPDGGALWRLRICYLAVARVSVCVCVCIHLQSRSPGVKSIAPPRASSLQTSLIGCRHFTHPIYITPTRTHARMREATTIYKSTTISSIFYTLLPSLQKVSTSCTNNAGASACTQCPVGTISRRA